MSFFQLLNYKTWERGLCKIPHFETFAGTFSQKISHSHLGLLLEVGPIPVSAIRASLPKPSTVSVTPSENQTQIFNVLALQWPH